MTVSYRVVLPAAGAGRRMGDATPKQYLRLLDRSVLEWAVAPFVADARCEQIMIAVAANDSRHLDLPSLRHPKIAFCIGGAERVHSVLAGLAALAMDQSAWVLVHDAARPCLHPNDLNELLRFAEIIGAEISGQDDGALLAIPLADTLKQANETKEVARTVPRAGLWRALTPQMFRAGVLQRALEQGLKSHIDITDEASAVEALGLHPRLITGRADNLKITYPEDLALAAHILAARQ